MPSETYRRVGFPHSVRLERTSPCAAARSRSLALARGARRRSRPPAPSDGRRGPARRRRATPGFEVDDDLDDDSTTRSRPTPGLGGGDAPDLRRGRAGRPHRRRGVLGRASTRTSTAAVRADLRRLLALRPRHRAAARAATRHRPTTTSPRTPSTARAPTSSPGTTSTWCPASTTQFGGFTLGIVFAHEFGHAIQDAGRRRGRHDHDRAPGRLLRRRLDGRRRPTATPSTSSSSLDDLDKAIAGFLELRDGVGTDAADPAAHGTGFDRIGAFIEGFEQGLERCARLPRPVRVRRARDRRGALHRRGGLRAGRQPAARRGGRPRPRGPPAVLGRRCSASWARRWTPSPAVTPIDPEHRRGHLRRRDLLRRRPRERVLLLRAPTTRSTSTP